MLQTDPQRSDADTIGQRDLARWDTRLGQWLVSVVTSLVRTLRPRSVALPRGRSATSPSSSSASSPSFPSGHPLNATVLTTVVFLVLIETTATRQRVVSIVAGLLIVVAMASAGSTSGTTG